MKFEINPGQPAEQLVESWTLDALYMATKCAMFLIAGGLIWWSVNNFSVAEPLGFDPLRYEYYAKYGLPNAFQDTSSFRMVVFLDLLYQYMPEYYGFLIVIGVVIFLVCQIDRDRIISAALFSPIAFYYLPQTGKDGLAIISLLAMAILTVGKKRFFSILIVTVVCSLALYIRPAIVIFIPIVVIQFRYGTFFAILICPFISYLFSANTDAYSILLNLGSLTSDEGTGAFASFLRQYTFGYEFDAISYKMGLLLSSIAFQPLIGFYKFYSGSPTFVLFEGASFALFLFLVIREKMILKFVIASIPYVIVVGFTSPFYHFRYLAIAYPVILSFCRYAPGLGWSGLASHRFLGNAQTIIGEHTRREIKVI